ncbi:MAG: hypothetical protein KDF49_08655 [Nitrosomonas sp.]|nr:hypothetical protein [Nitrosomonas sp.]
MKPIIERLSEMIKDQIEKFLQKWLGLLMAGVFLAIFMLGYGISINLGGIQIYNDNRIFVTNSQ